MPTRKIADAPPRPCSHPEHNPPSHRVFFPGTYEHQCPGCGATHVFVVSPVYCGGRHALSDDPVWTPSNARSLDGVVSFRW